MPSIADHQLEVVIVIYGCTDVMVVVLEFFGCDLSIDHPPNIEGVKKFLKYIVGSFLTRNDVRVLTGIVNIRDLNCIHNSISISIELVIGLTNQIFSPVIQRIT